MDSFWSDNAAPNGWHFFIAIYFAGVFFVFRFLFDKCIFHRLAIRMLIGGSVPRKITKATQAKIVKCTESLWKLTYYATVEACILKITYQEPWFKDTNLYFRGWPDQELKIPLKIYYMSQCGFYIYSILALLKWETKRKDFSVMMSHHVVTVILIWYSYITSFFRIGSVTLALHDASDVFMEAAKLCKYSGKEFAASVFFGCFAISWLLLRLIYYPFWVIRASSDEIRESLNLSEIYSMTLYYIFNTLLIMLLVFHIYWWVLICQMIKRQMNNRGQVGEDIRSDSEDDD